MRVQVVQMISRVGDVEGNLARMAELLEKAPKADLAVFPELAIPGYGAGKAFWELSEAADDSPSLREVGEMARRFDRPIAVGFAERSREVPGTLYNALALVSREGKLLTVYRKIHLWQEEQLFFARGATPVLAEVDGVKVGLAVCWDMAFPELSRLLCLEGAELIVAASAWDAPTIREWDIHLPARALENACFLAASNRGGADGVLAFGGHSQIVGPDGSLLAFAATDGEEVLTVDVDLTEVGRRRALEAPYFRDRAPWAYRLHRNRSRREDDRPRD